MSFCLYYGGNLVFSVSHTAVTLFIIAICVLCLAALFATASTAVGSPIRLDTDLESADDLEIAEPATRTSMSSPVTAMLKIRSPPRSPTAAQTAFPSVDPGTMV